MDAVERGQILAGCVMGQCDLVQMYQRCDYGHLLQAIPVSLVLLAWLCRLSVDAVRANPRRIAPISAMALIVSVSLLSVDRQFQQSVDQFHGLRTLAHDLKAYGEPREALIDRVLAQDPGDRTAQAMRYVRENTKPGDRILSLPMLTNFYYFVDRPFGGGDMALAPGYFTSNRDQQEMVSLMRQMQVDWIIDQPGFELDNNPAKRSRVFASVVYGYIDSHYAPQATFGTISVLRVKAAGSPPRPH
jgi:hypothetical protein